MATNHLDLRKKYHDLTTNYKFKKGLKHINSSHIIGKKVGLLLGPFLFVLLMFFAPIDGMTYEAKAVLASTLWIAVWWVTEPIPIPITSLLPILLFPLTGAVDSKIVSSAYGDNTIFLFLGGFMLALAMERWGLHRRIALIILSIVGTSANKIILGFMGATGFLSMWISNTAAAMMMVPIGLAIISNITTLFSEEQEMEISKFRKSMLLGIAYSASIGGLGTLIGTPPNIIFAGVVRGIYGVEISFAKWMLFGLPISIIMLLVAWLFLVKVSFRLKIKELPCSQDIIKNEKRNLGKMSFEEKVIFIVFLLAAISWITRPLINYFVPNLNDTMIAILAGTVLFLIPSSRERNKQILDWSIVKQIPWGILLLFGGGLAIANGFMNSGLASWIINQLTFLKGIHLFFIFITLAFIVKFLTEITSNTATATMLFPIMASLAFAIGVHPYGLMIVATLTSSMAFMLPVGTPPNAIVFGSNYLKVSDMVKAGFMINILSIILVVLAVYFILPMLWGIDIQAFPEII